MPEMNQVNIFFLAQGMVKVNPEEAPADLPSLPPEKVWEWAHQYVSGLTRQQLLDAVANISIEEDARPDYVEIQEEEGGDYEGLALSRVWHAWLYDNRKPFEPDAETRLPTADYQEIVKALDEALYGLESLNRQYEIDKGRRSQIIAHREEIVRNALARARGQA
jgi:hypothetical protein